MKNEVRFRVPRGDGTRETLSFDNNSIRQLREIRDTALDGRSLDVDTLTAVVESSSENIANFDQKQAVAIMRGGSRIRSYYISSAARAGKSSWRLSMVSAMGKLERIGHAGGIYQNVPAGDMIREICKGINVTVDEPFDSMLLTGWLPYASPSGAVGAQAGSAKDNLMQVLFAANASAWESANGVLTIGNFSAAPQSIIDEDKIFRGGYEIETQQAISDVELVEHSYAATEGEPEELFSGTATEGQRVIFSSPMHSLAATGSIAIAESGANYAVLGAGTGTLTGVPYSHIERTISAAVTPGATRNTATVDGATLVSVINSADVLARLVDFYKCRTIISADVLLSQEKPGDVISIYDRFTGAQTLACIEKISPAVYSNTLRASITALVGFTPWQQSAATDEMVVLTGAGSWTVPDGVTSLTIVLIGGGGGGSAGQDGANAADIAQKVSSPTYDGYAVVGALYSDYPTYGVGGSAGIAGKPGRILRATLSVSAGDSFAFSCGAGGIGAERGTEADTLGEDGGDTTFGSLTSTDGTAEAGGFADPSSGTIYGGTGTNGIRGGNGGGYGGESEAITSNPVRIAAENVEYNGKIYNAGATALRATVVGSDGRTYISDGGFGGGAAAGGNGGDGENAANPIPVENWRATNGGDGADAIKPIKALLGRGGNGGNGGGGGGSAGWWGRTPPVNTTANILPAAGIGGKGSDGGDGGDGCVLIYFRRRAV